MSITNILAMKSLILLFLSWACSFGQTLPYEILYKNQNGWREKMVFERSPEDPNIIIGSVYSYVDAQVPFYKMKSSVVCDTEKALAYVAQMQGRDLAIARANAAANDDCDRVVERFRNQGQDPDPVPSPAPDPADDRGSEAAVRRGFDETKRRHEQQAAERRIQALEKKLKSE